VKGVEDRTTREWVLKIMGVDKNSEWGRKTPA